MKRLVFVFATVLATLALAPQASADFGFKFLDLTFTGPGGEPAMQAGSHPFANETIFEPNTKPDQPGFIVPDEEFKDLVVNLPAGLAGSPNPVPRCSSADFLDVHETDNACPDSAAVGEIEVAAGVGAIEEGSDPFYEPLPVYNLVPSPGVAAKLGFTFLPGLDVTIDVGVNPDPPYNLQAHVTNIPQAALFYGSRTTIWGVPADPAHDPDRGDCLFSSKSCPVNLPQVPFLIMPRSCTGPLLTGFEADSWQNPGNWVKEGIKTHDDAEPPNPLGVGGCEKLGFAPQIAAAPTTDNASGPSGLDFNLDIEDEGLMSPEGIADSDIKKAVVTLPEGVTINPSQAEGLATCSEAELAHETAGSEPGEGCPQASKIGTAEVETPLVEGEIFKGSIFVATPYQNRFGSLLAIYMTIKSPKLGVGLRLAGKVEPDPKTGQLITTFDDLPQQPFSHFRFHFREGGRSPLITPPLCGTYQTKAVFTPWANPANPYTTTADFQITKGTGGGPCPSGGTPPFVPGFSAGTINNSAGSFSPFYMRLTRRDGDQDMTRFSAKLPPGMVAKLAGTTECPDANIAAAKARTGPHGGEEELASPSCPASSQIGRVTAGAGAGSQLTYVPGKVYLAGPFNGAPLSVVGIVPAVAGPFDVGTVVSQQALRVNPRSGEVLADGASSDPIPHILAGIPLKVRDIRVYVDKPNFTLNPTDCDPFAVGATLWGGGADVFSSADDAPISLSDRFQAANCAALGFKPRLGLKLKGGTKRGGHPALTGTYRPRPGDANLSDLVLRLPHSAFLDQAHIRTICTRVQFAQKACPPGAIYGQAKAITPLLDQPLEGPVFLRSSDHNLPDFVALLHGLIDVEAVARIDSSHGGIRATFSEVPDAPLTEVIVQMQGAKKGLIVNSTNLCAAKHRADAQMNGQNGKAYDFKPVVGADCGKKGKAKHKRHHNGQHRRRTLR